jgi:hypothetical protein
VPRRWLLEPAREHRREIPEPIMILSKILLRPLPLYEYSDWALACRLAFSTRDDHDEARALLRIVLQRDHRWTPAWIEDAIELARWAQCIMTVGNIQHVVGDDRDVWSALKDGILAALAQTNGNKAQAAAIFQSDRSTFYKKLKDYGIEGWIYA